ncbi:hypothetical protein BB560_000117 [Smittium megazygosporum]|uniref:Chromosome transmission fidelity protein 8 n=1 Tax=Smittium megazygosporum TaxID=133381 RepID=A0A2T9ZLA6_9FUNG|nr:hypothetical protein BB560_000117 [Smittium megazygosporum]
MSRVKINFDKSKISDDYCLIELHGTIQTDAPQLRNLQVGKFSIISNDKAELLIGAHKLEGKIVKLDKPLAMMMKVPADNNPLEGNSINENVSEFRTAKYDVLTIIKHKFIFKDRPIVN